MSVLRGAAAGLAATIPMSLAMEAMRAWLPGEQERPMPPREIVDRAVEKAGEAEHADEGERRVMTTVAHLAFGTAAGAVYGGVVGSRGASVLTGIGYGLSVWAAAYGVGMPSLGLHPAATDDTKERNEVLVGSHIVWGAVLGALVAASNHRPARALNAGWRRAATTRGGDAGRWAGGGATAGGGAFRR